MKLKQYWSQKAGKVLIKEHPAYRYNENKYSPLDYHPLFPKEELMKDLMDFIKNTSMSSTNKSFPMPKVLVAIKHAEDILLEEKTRHHRVIMDIVREDSLKKRELGLMLKDVDEFISRVTVK